MYSPLKKYSRILKAVLHPTNHYSGNGTIANLPRNGCPPKVTGHARRTLIREAGMRPMVTLKEQQSATGQVGKSVHWTTISRALHKSVPGFPKPYYR